MTLTYNDLNTREQAAIMRAQGGVIRFQKRGIKSNSTANSLVDKGIIQSAGIGTDATVAFRLTPLGRDICMQKMEAVFATMDTPEFQAGLNHGESPDYDLQDENAQLRKALQFYASHQTYRSGEFVLAPIDADVGKIAQDTLASLQSESE